MVNINHIHPMLVHFPIVLFVTYLLVTAYLVARKEDLAERKCLQMVAGGALLAGVIAALAAAAFGDIALDAALDKGFSKAPLEEHEELAGITIVIHGVLAVVLAAAVWKRIRLQGTVAVLLLIGAVLGLGSLVTTAYHGGELVYKEGVNVEAVTPVKK